jgi:hypothetical protein
LSSWQKIGVSFVAVVSDASPLITLAKIGRLELLPQLYETIVITGEVYDEVVIRGAGLAGSPAAPRLGRSFSKSGRVG